MVGLTACPLASAARLVDWLAPPVSMRDVRWTSLADRPRVRLRFAAEPAEMLSTIQYCEGWTWLLLVPMLMVLWMVRFSKKCTGGLMLTLPHVAVRGGLSGFGLARPEAPSFGG